MLLLQLFAALYCFPLPGVLVVLCLDHPWTLPVAMLVGAAAGALAIPMVSFCAAWILGTSISLWLVAVVATAVNVPAAAVFWFRRRQRHGA